MLQTQGGRTSSQYSKFRDMADIISHFIYAQLFHVQQIQVINKCIAIKFLGNLIYPNIVMV